MCMFTCSCVVRLCLYCRCKFPNIGEVDKPTSLGSSIERMTAAATCCCCVDGGVVGGGVVGVVVLVVMMFYSSLVEEMHVQVQMLKSRLYDLEIKNEELTTANALLKEKLSLKVYCGAGVVAIL